MKAIELEVILPVINNGKSKVIFNGEDITNSVTGIEIISQIEDVTKVRLDFYANINIKESK